MAQRVASVVVGSGSSQKLNPGDFNPPKGKIMKAMICKLTVPINNTTGGALATGLSAANKVLLLNNFLFNVAFGANQERKPYVATTATRMRLLARDAFNSEIEGWTADSAAGTGTGLERNLPNAATTNVIFYLPIPLGQNCAPADEEQHIFGMGRTQQKSLEIEIRRTSDAIAANIVVNGNVTVEFYPHYESCKGDVVGLVPYYREVSSQAEDVTLDFDGLPLLVTERTAASHLATTLTNVSLWIDGEVIHDQIDAKEVLREYADDWRLSTAGLITDVETVLYKPALDSTLRFMQTGRVRIRQNVKSLTTIALSIVFVPYFTPTEIDKDIVAYGTWKGGKLIRAANADLYRGLQIPKRTQGLPAYVLYDADERERQSLPGLEWASGMSQPVVKVPGAILGAAQSRISAFKAAGESSSASNVAKELAAIIPGSITDGRGARGEFSARLAAVSSVLGQ